MIKLKGGHEGAAQSEKTGVLRRGNLDTDRGKAIRRHREKTPATGQGGRPQKKLSASIFDSDFQLSELCGKKCLLFKPPVGGTLLWRP